MEFKDGSTLAHSLSPHMYAGKLAGMVPEDPLAVGRIAEIREWFERVCFPFRGPNVCEQVVQCNPCTGVSLVVMLLLSCLSSNKHNHVATYALPQCTEPVIGILTRLKAQSMFVGYNVWG